MSKKPINHYKHPDKRSNNPTQELSGFAEDEENAPTRYPRDTALDPQLVWKGKDQQNDSDLAVPGVPIYIQEHIQPQAIIENLSTQQQSQAAQTEMLFEGFDTLAFREKIEFYQHAQQWQNRFILGDSLSVMTSLSEKEHLRGGVQMIYVDPPYGIKFRSNWQVSTRKREVGEMQAADVTVQPEQVKAFRDTWELGIHSYLAYLRDRLTVARELLTESGSIFVQISDQNVHLVRSLLDEVFGSENFVSTIAWVRGHTTSSTSLSSVFDYLMWYAKDREKLKYNQLWVEWDERSADPLLASYMQVELPDLTRRRMTSKEKKDPTKLPEGSRRFVDYHATSQSGNKDTYEFNGTTFIPTGNRGWVSNQDGLERLAKQGRLLTAGKSLRYIRWASDSPGREITNLWTDTSGGRSGKAYVVETNPKVIQRCLLMTTAPGDLVLDPTCGSGTTAYVAEQWGRRWITIDTSRVALALARTRLMSAKYPYYRLQEKTDIKRGFHYKTAPYIRLSDMTNNTAIDDVHEAYAKRLDPLLKILNAKLPANRDDWKDWEVPMETDPEWPPEFQALHQQWLSLKHQRQREMDASTAQLAKQEILYDQPEVDRNRIRVTGPFTVESLSPHIVLDPSESEREGVPTPMPPATRSQDYHTHILHHLKTAGVEHRLKDQRMNFDWLELLPGGWIHAEGVVRATDGTPQSIAVSIGPEYDTVGRHWIEAAAKAAMRRIPKFDLLLVVGFAFEGYTADENTRLGPLTILPVKMSPELLVRELKNTGEGNLFRVFGEPDIEILPHADGKVSVKLLGVDVYDPNRGLIRSDTPDAIACWFIDTAYSGDAFFVRHAYWTGADAPYQQLQRALHAEIDAAAWEALYRTESLPFAKPTTGKIAVKVINHYGDEVMKEYRV